MSNKSNFLVDSAIFAGFLVASQPAMTGLAIHEWLSVSFLGAGVVHILLHWEWIKAVTAQFFKKLWHASRLNYVLNVLLLFALTAVMLSGLMISKSVMPFLGLSGLGNPGWRMIHSTSADAILILIGLHVALHWKWIVNTTNRYLINPVMGTLQPKPTPRPAGTALNENQAGGRGL
jgi:hypothetical protein